MKELAEALKARSGLRMRQGVVTGVDGSTCSVLIGGSDVPVDGVQHLNSCAPAAGDVVWIASDGADLWIIGTHGDPPPIDPSRLPDFETYFTDADSPGAPAAVSGLAGDAAFSTVILSWDLPPETMWRTWKVYEGAAAGFEPGDPVLTTTECVVRLSKDTGSGPWYYKVRAVNSRGEASADVEVGPLTLPALEHVDLGPGSVYATNMAAGAVDLASAVVTGQLVAAKLADNAVTQAKLASAIVDATKLADDAVTSAKLAAGAVDNAALADLAVSGGKIAAGAVTAAKIAAGTITANEIAAATITGAKIAAGTIAAGNIAAGAVTTAKLAAGAVTANEIAADTIVAGSIAAGAIGAAEIAAGAVIAGKIAAGAVTATEIAAGAITTAKLAAGAVTANELAAGSVTAAKIVAGTITADRIATGAITANEIAAGTITAAKLNVADVQAAVVTAAKVNALTLNAVTITGGSITGVSITGQTITGGTIRTAASGHRVEISPQAYMDIRMPSGYSGTEYSPAALGAYYNSYDPDSPILNISGPDIGWGQAGITITGTGMINLFPTNPTTPRVRVWGALRLMDSCASGVSEDGVWINDLSNANRRWKLYMYNPGSGYKLYMRYGSGGAEFRSV